MVAINSAPQIDLTAPVCADSIGCKFYSGVGGQADFLRDATHSRGGKPIIALPSTALKGTVSRIVPVLDTGAGCDHQQKRLTLCGHGVRRGESVRQKRVAVS
jgi:4-hydroxybutyrate CoA-transferase